MKGILKIKRPIGAHFIKKDTWLTRYIILEGGLMNVHEEGDSQSLLGKVEASYEVKDIFHLKYETCKNGKTAISVTVKDNGVFHLRGRNDSETKAWLRAIERAKKNEIVKVEPATKSELATPINKAPIGIPEVKEKAPSTNLNIPASNFRQLAKTENTGDLRSKSPNAWDLRKSISATTLTKIATQIGDEDSSDSPKLRRGYSSVSIKVRPKSRPMSASSLSSTKSNRSGGPNKKFANIPLKEQQISLMQRCESSSNDAESNNTPVEVMGNLNSSVPSTPTGTISRGVRKKKKSVESLLRRSQRWIKIKRQSTRDLFLPSATEKVPTVWIVDEPDISLDYQDETIGRRPKQMTENLKTIPDPLEKNTTKEPEQLDETVADEVKLLSLSRKSLSHPKLSEITKKDVEAVMSPIMFANQLSIILAQKSNSSSPELTRRLGEDAPTHFTKSCHDDIPRQNMNKKRTSFLAGSRPKSKHSLLLLGGSEDTRKTWTFFVDQCTLPPAIPEKSLTFKKRQIEKLLAGEIRPIIGPINNKEIRALLIPINHMVKKCLKTHQLTLETYDVPKSLKGMRQ